MSPLRLGAVEYLNARPLVYGLHRHADRFDVRFDIPARCAERLHAGQVDIGLVPSIEYLRGGPYVAVPGVAIGSDGPVASVAVFSRLPIDRVRTVALDASSRTSVALFTVLCARHFGIEIRAIGAGPALVALVLYGVLPILQNTVAGLRGVDPAAREATDQVFFGATVRYATGEGRENRIRIVGIDEVDPARGQVSWISPIARALIKAREGDSVTLRTPVGVETLEILEVRYEAS
jgi:hypothetical protein